MIYFIAILLIIAFLETIIILYINFQQNKIPQELPQDLKGAINDLRGLNKENVLKKVYTILAEKYKGNRIKTYTRCYQLFNFNLEKLWNQKGFMYCTAINYIFKIILLNSGFKAKDIRLKWTQIWYMTPHQYLQIRINEEWINIDVWSVFLGTKFGDYSHGLYF